MNRTMSEAIEEILQYSHIRFSQSVTIDEALDRVLAEDIYAKYDIPKEPKSAIDGYTFKFDSIKEYPAKLKIIGESRAGIDSGISVGDGEAVFTMTGAVVPNGADTAVRIEDVQIEDSFVIIPKAPKKGDLINEKGSEIERGTLLLKKGERLDYKKIALLANTGHFTISVYTKPKIGIIVTGNEVKEPWESGDGADVRNSNLYILKNLLKDYADIIYFGKVVDEVDRMLPVFKRALDECDILLSSGGASKGKYDFTVDIAQKLGLNIHFNTTNIRPGRPLIFGTKEQKLFFGLPGYPSALLVNVMVFLLPALKKINGYREYKSILKSAIAKEPFRAKKGRNDFIRVVLEYRDGKIFAISSGSQQTSNFESLSKSEALLLIDDSRGSVEIGEVVEFFEI